MGPSSKVREGRGNKGRRVGKGRKGMERGRKSEVEFPTSSILL